jgi:hypothetical protein
MSVLRAVEEKGYAVAAAIVGAPEIASIEEELEGVSVAAAGARNLLELGWCRALVLQIRDALELRAVAVQCTLFDKTPGQNWLVPLPRFRCLVHEGGAAIRAGAGRAARTANRSPSSHRRLWRGQRAASRCAWVTPPWASQCRGIEAASRRNGRAVLPCQAWGRTSLQAPLAARLIQILIATPSEGIAFSARATFNRLWVAMATGCLA